MTNREIWKITTERRNKSKWDYFFPLRSQVCTKTHGVSMQQDLPGKCPDLLQTPSTQRQPRREKSPCCWSLNQKLNSRATTSSRHTLERGRKCETKSSHNHPHPAGWAEDSTVATHDTAAEEGQRSETHPIPTHATALWSKGSIKKPWKNMAEHRGCCSILMGSSDSKDARLEKA